MNIALLPYGKDDNNDKNSIYHKYEHQNLNKLNSVLTYLHKYNQKYNQKYDDLLLDDDEIEKYLQNIVLFILNDKDKTLQNKISYLKCLGFVKCESKKDDDIIFTVNTKNFLLVNKNKTGTTNTSKNYFNPLLMENISNNITSKIEGVISFDFECLEDLNQNQNETYCINNIQHNEYYDDEDDDDNWFVFNGIKYSYEII
jgi:hypothetical protein